MRVRWKWLLREEKQGDPFLIFHQALPIHFPSKYKIRRAECTDSHVVCKLSHATNQIFICTFLLSMTAYNSWFQYTLVYSSFMVTLEYDWLACSLIGRDVVITNRQTFFLKLLFCIRAFLRSLWVTCSCLQFAYFKKIMLESWVVCMVACKFRYPEHDGGYNFNPSETWWWYRS